MAEPQYYAQIGWIISDPYSITMTSKQEDRFQEPIARLSSVCYKHDGGSPVNGVDLDLHAGDLHVLIGATDSGRTLILQMLMGLISPDSGEISIFGDDPKSDPVRQRMGATLYETHLPGSMRVREIVDLVRVHYYDTLTTDELLEAFGISYLAERLAETLDQGEENWVFVALAFAGKPDLVVLDQPTAGMDFDWRLMLWRHLREYTGQGGSVVMSTHFISEAEEFADCITIVSKGQIVTSGTPEEIKNQGNRRRIHVATRTQLDLGDGCEIEQVDGAATIYTNDSDATVRQMIQAGVDFEDLRIDQGSLEEAIIALTGDQDL